MPDAWRQVAVVAGADGTLSVYLDGSSAAELVVPAAKAPALGATVRLFKDDGVEESAGELARLRLFSAALSAEQVSGLQPLDVTDPMPQLSMPEGPLWLGPNSAGFDASAFDDGSGPVALDWFVVHDRADSPNIVVDKGEVTQDLSVDNVGPGNDLIETAGFSAMNPSTLVNGEPYKLTLRAIDKAANFRLGTSRAFTWDDQAPAGMTLAGPDAETSDRTPLFSGAAATGANDDRAVFAIVCKGAECDHGDASDFVGYVEGAVVDGRWSGELVKVVGDDHANPVAVGDLANGDYVAIAFQGDSAYNTAEARRTFRVVDPPAKGDVTPPTVAQPTVTEPGVVSTAAPATVQQLVARLLAASVQQLAGEGLSGLTKDGKAAVTLGADRPGTAIVQFFLGSAPKKVAPTAVAAAKKKKARKVVQKNLLGTGSRRFTAPGSGAVTVKLSRKARTRLKGRKSARIVVRTIFVPTTGAPVVRTQAVKVKR